MDATADELIARLRRNPDDAAACKYQVAFGGTLGTIQISGADLMKVPKPT